MASEDLIEQTEQTFNNIENVLERRGVHPDFGEVISDI